MQCQEFREMIDSYIGDELLVETNHEVLHHLENCAACRGKLAAHRELRARVSSAIKNSPEAQINVAFAQSLQASLRETALRPPVWEQIRNGDFINLKVLTLAAGLLIASLFGTILLNRSPLRNEQIVAENNQPNRTIEVPQPVESPTGQAVKAAWREIAETAIGDHENCAVKFRLEEQPITLTEAARKYGRFNKDLDKAVVAALHTNPVQKSGDEIEFLHAHSCIFGGRRFAHLILKYRNRTVSVLVTDTDLPDGDTINGQTDGDKMQAASFSVAHHTVFVVSDLTEAENTNVARIISPSIRRHIEKSEA